MGMSFRYAMISTENGKTTIYMSDDEETLRARNKKIFNGGGTSVMLDMRTDQVVFGYDQNTNIEILQAQE
jgi:hypothetical protein